jgi:hypothetical protein
MGRLRFDQSISVAVTIFLLFAFLPACGGHKPPGVSSFPAVINISPSTSYSLQAGTVVQFAASARNSSNSPINASFTFLSSNNGVVDISATGSACAGSWNAPLYTVCTPNSGTGNNGATWSDITATTLGVVSPPTVVFVHPYIASIQVSVVPPVNSPPPACPAQIALPLACQLPLNPTNSCLSPNQLITLQATAYDSQGNNITDQVGAFVWSQTNFGVSAITPIVTDNNVNVPTNQATATPATPGQTLVVASASGVSSQPFDFETCPVQCIALELNVSGNQQSSQTTFVASKGTSQTVTATAVDVQGCIVPKAPLTWISSEPAAISAGGTGGCASGTATCTISTSQPGAAAITATCTPPSCNVGFPLNLNPNVAAPYIPQPVYPVTSISGYVTGAPSPTSVLTTSLDCYSDQTCSVALYNVLTANNLAGAPTQIPTPPNSFLMDLAGDRAYSGSQFGALSITPSSLGTSTGAFAALAAPGTTLGLVAGKVLAISHTGTSAVFSDTVSTPNQVYFVNASNSTTALNINSAVAAAFSPDGLRVFILGNGGNTLYMYSPLQFLQTLSPNPLPAPATSIVFNSTGTFALLSGGSPTGSLAVYNTCDSSLVTPYLGAAALTTPPIFLKMVPPVDVPLGSLYGGIPIPDLETTGLDFFIGVDNTGIDLIATNASQGPLTTLCPQPVTLAYTPPAPPTPGNTFAPVHINIGQGNFNPISFFLSPDGTKAYIVTTDDGIFVYDFQTNSASNRIGLVNNATPISADMTVDGTLMYVVASDGLLHQINIPLSVDQTDIAFVPLANSSNAFCYNDTNCSLNVVVVKP